VVPERQEERREGEGEGEGEGAAGRNRKQRERETPPLLRGGPEGQPMRVLQTPQEEAPLSLAYVDALCSTWHRCDRSQPCRSAHRAAM
jgi:hypothetical protein